MKTLLAFVLLAASAFAADAITVDGNMNVVIGNSTFGRVEDYVKAKPETMGDVMLAIRAFHASVLAQAEVKTAEAVAAIDTAAQKVAVAETKAADESARASSLVAALAKVEASTLPDEVKSAMLTASEKERDALTKQKAEIEAKMAALPSK